MTIHVFQGYKRGSAPEAPVVDERGTLFGGVSGGGGPCECGIVFRLGHDAGSYSFASIYSLKGPYSQPVPDGSYPVGNMVAGANGTLYGATRSGGQYFGGTIFELVPSQQRYSETILHAFQGGSDGSQPASLVLSGGVLYGVTRGGGGVSYGYGTVFSLTGTGSGATENILYAFQGGSDGAIPSSLVADHSGSLYGVTGFGGGATSECSQGCGTVFKLTPSSGEYSETILYRFQGQSDGSFPTSLIIDKTGTLYGVTENGLGTVFELAPTGSGYTMRQAYAFRGGPYGWSPTSLVIDARGVLYGTTQNGGNDSPNCFQFGCGTLFKLTPEGSGYTQSTIYEFQGTDGAAPFGLILARGGILYGTTAVGGNLRCNGGTSYGPGCGTVFEVKPRSNE